MAGGMGAARDKREMEKRREKKHPPGQRI